jgi:hypothetical protein
MNDIPTHKMVNGEVVTLTLDEVVDIVAEWSKNQSNPDYVFSQRVAAGYDTSLGWFLPIDDESRAALGELRTQLNEGISLGAWTNNTPCPVQLRAKDGSLHSGTIGEIRSLIFEAGNYYAQLVTARRAAQNG